jgi:hypothetical protein
MQWENHDSRMRIFLCLNTSSTTNQINPDRFSLQ